MRFPFIRCFGGEAFPCPFAIPQTALRKPSLSLLRSLTSTTFSFPLSSATKGILCRLTTHGSQTSTRACNEAAHAHLHDVLPTLDNVHVSGWASDFYVCENTQGTVTNSTQVPPCMVNNTLQQGMTTSQNILNILFYNHSVAKRIR